MGKKGQIFPAGTSQEDKFQVGCTCFSYLTLQECYHWFPVQPHPQIRREICSCGKILFAAPSPPPLPRPWLFALFHEMDLHALVGKHTESGYASVLVFSCLFNALKYISETLDRFQHHLLQGLYIHTRVHAHTHMYTYSIKLGKEGSRTFG